MKIAAARGIMINYFRKNSLRLVVGLVLLFAFIQWSGMPGIVRGKDFQIDLPLMLLALATSLSFMVLRALRWNVVLGQMGCPLPLGKLFGIYDATFLLGTVAPGPVAEIARIYLTRTNARGVRRSAAAVILHRAFDVVPNLIKRRSGSHPRHEARRQSHF